MAEPHSHATSADQEAASCPAGPLQVGLRLAGAERIAQEASAAERAGFDYLCVGEHIFFHGPSVNAFVALAVAAGATSTIRLLSAVTLLPLYPAALAAKMAAVLDAASGQRFCFGVGVGGDYPPEFAAVGVPVSERGARADEALKVIRRLFDQAEVTFRGRWAELDRLGLQPGPARPGGPPLWIAGRTEAAMRRAGRFGEVWMPYLFTPERLARGLALARQSAAEAGRDPAQLRGSVYLFLAVHADRDRALQMAAASVGGKYRRQLDPRQQQYLVAGTPAQCIARIRQFQQAGAESVMLNLACPPDGRDQMLTMVARELLPALHG